MALLEEFESQGNFLFKRRGFLPVLILIPAMILYVWQIQKGSGSSFVFFNPFLCLGVSLFGMVIRMFTIGYTADNTSGRNTSVGQVADDVNTRGIYSIVRHPLYVGNYFNYLGVAMLLNNIWFILVYTLIFWLYYERIMFAEERFLTRKYKDKYTEWAASAPAFIPKLSGWKSNTTDYQWGKVIKQEKTGFLNIFMVFFLFEMLRQYFTNTAIELNGNVWLYMFVGSVIWYVLIKVLQKTTSIFS